MLYIVRQEKFEGPLGLLLELIEKEKLVISEVSLSRVTEEYLRYIRSLGHVDPVRSKTPEVSADALAQRTSNGIDPEELAEFLVVAAQLMLIKSRSLLPSLQLDEENEASIADLERRLQEYQRIRELAQELKALERQKRYMVTRESFTGIESLFYPPPKLTLDALRQAFAAFLAALPKLEKLVEEKIKKIISLEEKISHIRSFLSGSLEKAFSDIVRGSAEKVDIIVSFLAILELAKQKFVDLDQDELFADIKIKRI